MRKFGVGPIYHVALGGALAVGLSWLVSSGAGAGHGMQLAVLQVALAFLMFRAVFRYATEADEEAPDRHADFSDTVALCALLSLALSTIATWVVVVFALLWLGVAVYRERR